MPSRPLHQHAGYYDDRTTAAVKSVLNEIGQILGSFEGKFPIIGGAVPWPLPGKAEILHIGTADVDLGLDPTALGECALPGENESKELGDDGGRNLPNNSTGCRPRSRPKCNRANYTRPVRSPRAG